MTVSLRTRRRLWRWLVFVVLGGIAGIFYTVVILPSDRSGAASWLTGARAGMLIAGGASGLELFVIYGAWGAVLRRLPFLQFLGLRVAAHATLITLLLIFNTYIGRMLGERWADYAFEPKQVLASIAFSLLALTIALFVAQAQSLIGGRTLANVVLGRYHRPRHEERLFLLFDVKGSTPLAVRLGDEKFHELLADIFFDIDAPITELGGEVYEYVGDAVIATWPLGVSESEQHAIRAIFAARAAVQARAAGYQQKYGTVPEFRAVLHRGSVVAGECGASKRQIVYRGETLNTIARLEALAKDLGKDAIITDTGQGAGLPAGIRSEDLGRHALKGLDTPVHVLSLVEAA
jgi:adenylate cyclase